MMFCKTCGTKVNDNAAFCPKCGTRVVSDSPNPMMQDDGNYRDVNANLRSYLVRGVVGITAVILAGVSIVVLLRLVRTIEVVIDLFSGYDASVAGIGIAGYIACGLLLSGCAALAALPVAKNVLEGESIGQKAIDRSMALSVTLLVLCIAVWICKLIFHSPVGSDVSAILYNIFSTFGSTSMSCMLPVIAVIALLYIIRTTLIIPNGLRY